MFYDDYFSLIYYRDHVSVLIFCREFFDVGYRFVDVWEYDFDDRGFW